MSLEKDFISTLNSIRSLQAKRPDDLEDYFHDAIVSRLALGLELKDWMPYIHKAVVWRVLFGNREGRMDLSLEEELVGEAHPINLDAKVDVQRAMTCLTRQQAAYVYEYFFDEFTQDEIAMRHDVTQQNVQKVLQTALNKMRHYLVTGLIDNVD